MSGGGGGGTNTVTSTQEFRPPSYITQGGPNGSNLWSDYVNNVTNNASQPYTPNPNQQTADLNNTQRSGLDMAISIGRDGTPIGNQASQSVMGMLQNGGQDAPGLSSNVQSGTNPYAGANPYLEGMINNTADLMNRQYQQGTQAQQNAAAARGGAFGSSAYQQMFDQGQAGLASSIGNMANQYRMGDYTTQQGLSENALNRNVGTQEYNQGQKQGAYNQNQQNMLGAAGLAGGQLYQNDVNGARMVTGAGDAINAYQQQTLDDQNNAWNAQQQYPWQMLQNVGGALSQASGTSGSSSYTTQGQGGAPSWLSGLLGGGALGLGALNYFGH